MVFTFVLFIGPQFIFPALEAARPAAVSAGLALAVYVLNRVLAGRPLSVNAPIVRLMVLLLGLAALSIPTSRHPGGSMDVLLDQFGKSVLLFILVANTVNTVRRMKLILGSMGVWGIIMSWTAVRDFSAGKLAAGGVRIAGYDSPLAGNPNDLALTLNLLLAFVLGLYMATRKPLARVFWLSVMALLAGGIISSFSRGGFLALAAIAIVVAAKQVKERGAVAFFYLGVIVLLFIFVMPHGYGDRVLSIFDARYDTTGTREARWEGMVFGWGLMLESPVVGQGLDMNGLAFVERGMGWTGIHNVFLQIGADLGVPALLVYLALIWRLFNGLRQWQKPLRGLPAGRELLALGYGIEVALIAFLVGGYFAPVAYHFYFYYIAGFAVAFQEMATRLASRFAQRS